MKFRLSIFIAATLAVGALTAQAQEVKDTTQMTQLETQAQLDAKGYASRYQIDPTQTYEIATQVALVQRGLTGESADIYIDSFKTALDAWAMRRQ
jgi:hypothetical protein